VPIDKRTIVVKERKRPGDIEVHFMIEKNIKGALLVMKDRGTLNKVA
jgi:IS30 family transposase